MIGQDSLERPRRSNVLLLLVRILLFWSIRAVIIAFLQIRRALRPKRVRYGLLLLVAGGAVAWNALSLALLRPAAPPVATVQTWSTLATGRLPQPAVVEHYLKAQGEYNAAGMWETMSERLRQRMAASNNSLAQVQAGLEEARQRERRYSGASYVGGMPIEGDRNVYFYVLTMDTPTGSFSIPYTFIVGQDDKIMSIQ